MHKFRLEEKFDRGRVLVEVSLTNSDLARSNQNSIKAALMDKLCDRWDLEIIRPQRRVAKRKKTDG